MRVTILLCVVATTLLACATESADMKKLCAAKPTDDTAAFAQWASTNIHNSTVREMLRQLASVSKEEAIRTLRERAAANGISTCKIAEHWHRRLQKQSKRTPRKVEPSAKQKRINAVAAALARQAGKTGHLSNSKPTEDRGIGGSVGVADISRVTVTYGKLQGAGKLSTKAVESVARRHVGKLRICYDLQLIKEVKPAKSGLITLQVGLAGDGRVVGVTTIRDTLGSAGVVACVSKAVARWSFPAPGAAVKIPLTWRYQRTW